MAKIDQYLTFMVDNGASDFHLSSHVRPTIRVDGEIITATEDSSDPFSPETVQEILAEIMPDRNREEYVRDCDTDFAYELAGTGRFRVNAFADRKGGGAVFRHIPDDIRTMEDLELPPVFYKFCKLRKGLVLVTGPTGSGKSTTLAAMVDHINTHGHGHIITIEDPIEFVHQNKNCLINQREVRHHTESFKRALRAALREDPDIILVGEMRDLETTEMAIETAETGHLVLGTLHTSTATSTVDRIIDQFPAERQGQIRTMLSSSLKGIACQTLMRRKNQAGRIAAFEIMVSSHAVATNIREGKSFQLPSIIQTSRAAGMQLFNDHLLSLVQAGTIEAQEAYEHSTDKAALLTKLKMSGFQVEE